MTAAQVDSGLTLTLVLPWRGSSCRDAHADRKREGPGHRRCDVSRAADHHRDGSATCGDDVDHRPPPRPARPRPRRMGRLWARCSQQHRPPAPRRPPRRSRSPRGIFGCDRHGYGVLASQGFAAVQPAQGPGRRRRYLGAAGDCVTDDLSSTGTTTASLASQSFALLNQYLAGSTGRVDSGQIVASVSKRRYCGSGIVPDQTAH